METLICFCFGINGTGFFRHRCEWPPQPHWQTALFCCHGARGQVLQECKLWRFRTLWKRVQRLYFRPWSRHPKRQGILGASSCCWSFGSPHWDDHEKSLPVLQFTVRWANMYIYICITYMYIYIYKQLQGFLVVLSLRRACDVLLGLASKPATLLDCELLAIWVLLVWFPLQCRKKKLQKSARLEKQTSF